VAEDVAFAERDAFFMGQAVVADVAVLSKTLAVELWVVGKDGSAAGEVEEGSHRLSYYRISNLNNTNSCN